MKKILFLFAVVALISCNDEAKVDSMSTDTGTKEMDNTVLPYTAGYSSQFEMAKDNKNTGTILSMWKAWDGGDIMKMKDHFADSVTMMLANGYVMSGPRDTVLKESQAYRDGFSSMTSYPDAWISTKSTDKNEDWVSIWGKEISTDKAGKTDSVYLQESWMLKDGKVNLMLQHTRSLTMPKQ